jgi:hypothetical protein
LFFHRRKDNGLTDRGNANDRPPFWSAASLQKLVVLIPIYPSNQPITKTRLFREVSSAIPAESRQFSGENGSGEACLAATGKFKDLMAKGLIHGTT